MDIITKYFPHLEPNQCRQLKQLQPLYSYWNEQINLISRSDIENLYEHHVLHSLAIAKFYEFLPGTSVMDVGTGGGFPGIPLAIMFPQVKFHLIDSVFKKVNTARTIAMDLGLLNVTTEHGRVEEHLKKYDFVVSRAVARTATLIDWTHKNIFKDNKNDLPNGYIFLKGGDLRQELSEIDLVSYCIPVTDYFKEEYFKEKYIVYISENE